MAIPLEEAMGRIATVQTALVSNGYNIGAWGPCGNGIDGRWGSDTQTGWLAYIQASGQPDGTDQAIANLGVSGISMAGLQEAVTTWNRWRQAMAGAGNAPGSAIYEQAALAALATATGITAQTCPQLNGNGNGGAIVPTNGGTMAPTQKKPFPWWILGMLAVAVTAGGFAVWWFSKEDNKKGSRRVKRAAPAMAGWGSKGPEITDEELGGGYEGYKPPAEDTEPEESEEGG